MKILTLVSTLTLTLLIALALAGNVGAVTPYHSTNGIWEEKLTAGFAVIEVGNGDTLYAAANGPPRVVKRSLDDGATWTTVKTFTRTSGGVKSLFVDSKGRVYVGLYETGKVLRGVVSGDSLAFSDVLTMQCATGSGSWWNMAEAAAGSLFVGNYGGTLDEHCAAIYRSSHGAHWTQVYYTANQNRHIHVIGVDPWSDEVYAGIGDIPLATARIVRSQNYGATWDTVRVGTPLCKPISLAFTPTRKLWGSDVGNAGSAIDSTNVIEWTADDSAYTQGLKLTGAEDNYVWAMASTDQRTIFAGTSGKQGAGSDIRMYASWDSGGSWYTVKEFECAGNWNGVKWISRKADNDGFSYYCVSQASKGGYDSYRFTGAAVWTVGSGGDFGTLGGAIADFATGPCDTLVMLAGTHVANADSVVLYEGMTVRGATTDASLYIIMNALQSKSAIDVSQNGCVLANLTFRDERVGVFTTAQKAMIEVDDNATLTVKRCNFLDVQGYTAPGLICIGDAAGVEVIDITFEDCYAESCDATGAYAEAAGLIYVQDANAVTIDGCMFIGNSSAHDGGAVKLNSNFGHSNISNSLFANNTCDNLGAALYAKTRNAYDVTVDYCTFDANTSATPAEGQVFFGQAAPTHTLSHSIISNGGSTYALANTSWCDIVSHVDSWGNGVNNLGWNSATGTDTIYIDPSYNCETVSDSCYAAKAKECRNSTDGSYMGWLEYTPPAPPTPLTVNPALQQDAFYQDLYAASDTVCCHASHWDMVVPDLTYAGNWSIFPYGAKSKLADGINVKVTLAHSNDGWSETYFVPVSYDTAPHWKNEFALERLFSTAVDTIAVQAVFSTCAAGSLLQYQFIMEGW